MGIEAGQLVGDVGEGILARGLQLGDAAFQRAAHGLEPFGEAVEKRGRIRPGEALVEFHEPRLQRLQPGEDGLHRRILLGIEPGQLVRDLGEGVFLGLQRGQPALQRTAHRFQPLGEAGEGDRRVLSGEAAVDFAQAGLQRLEPGEDRLHRRVLLGIEAGQLVGDVGEGILARGLQLGDAAFQRAAHGLQPLGETVEERGRIRPGEAAVEVGEAGLQRLQPGEHRLDRGVLLRIEAGQLVGDVGEGAVLGLDLGKAALHRVQPLGEAVEERPGVLPGEAAVELGQARLQRLQPGEDRLHGGILLRIEARQLGRDFGEGVLFRRLQQRDPGGKGGFGRGMGGLQRRDPVLELGLQARDPGGGVAGLDPERQLAEAGLQRLQPGEHRLDRGILAGMEPGELLGHLGQRVGGLQRRDPGLQRGAGLVDAGGEPVEGGGGVAGGEALLQRGDPGEHGFGHRILLGVEPGQAVGELGHGILGRRLQPGDARLQRRGSGGLAAADLVEPALEPLQQGAGLGRLAHLLDRPHPLAQLVETGEGGLQRGVLVAHEAEELGGHPLQALLRGRLAGAERLDPGGEIGLGGGEGFQPGRRGLGPAVADPDPGEAGRRPGAALGRAGQGFGGGGPGLDGGGLPGRGLRRGAAGRPKPQAAADAHPEDECRARRCQDHPQAQTENTHAAAILPGETSLIRRKDRLAPR